MVYSALSYHLFISAVLPDQRRSEHGGPCRIQSRSVGRASRRPGQNRPTPGEARNGGAGVAVAARRRRARAQGPPARNNLPRHDRLHFCGAAITLLPFVDRLFIVYLSFFQLFTVSSIISCPSRTRCLGSLSFLSFRLLGTVFCLSFVYRSGFGVSCLYHSGNGRGLEPKASIRPICACSLCPAQGFRV